MSIIKVDYGQMSSGSSCVSGTTVKVNGVETSSVSGVSSQFTVETGLSNISRFMLTAKPAPASGKIEAVIYDSNIYADHQYGIWGDTNLQGTGASVPYTGSINISPIINSISGGTVTLTTASHLSYCDISNIYWFAE